MTKGAIKGFEGVVQEATGNEDYKFGDLTRRTFRAMDGLVETALERSTRRILSVEFSTSPEHSPEPEPA